MPNINLIQDQRLAAKREEGKARLFFMGFAVSAALGLVVVGGLFVVTERASSEEASLRAKAQRVQPLVDEIDKTNAEYMKVAPKVTTLEGARKMTDKWVTVLDHLTANTPEQTWLTSIRGQQGDPKAPISVMFAGMSTRQELIGEFMLRLQDCPELENVNLKFSQEKPVASGSRIEFQVDGGLVGTQEEKETVKEETE